MVYKICGGLFFLLSAASLLGLFTVPSMILGVFALLAGIALLASL